MSAMSGYDGANWWSTNRGYVYFPTLDSRKDLDSYSRYELIKKSRWLYINSGFATRIIDGIANMVGALTPVPLTDDREWNQLALKSFNNSAGADLVFDVSGKFNFWSAQVMLTKLRLLDGDILAVLTESVDSHMARIMFYEGHQIGNYTDDGGDTQWNDGVLTTPQNRAIAFRVIEDADPLRNAIDPTTKSVDIPARDAILCCQYHRPGRSRGEPALRHAINHLLDRAEIIGFVKTGIKNAAQVGYQITKNAALFGSDLTLETLKGTGAGVKNQTLADGTKIKVEDAYRGGKILEMDPGEEIKLLLDQRPHPNQVEALDYLARDASWGLNCSSDILWNMAKLGGATARFVLADAQQGVVEPQQELNADQFCSRFWVYYIAKELKTGRLRPCQDPEWWKHGWQPQQKLTVDITRDGRLFIDIHKSGLISLKRYHAIFGNNWKAETDDFIDERAYIVQSVMEHMITMPDGTVRAMTMDEAFPPAPGSMNVTERATVAGLPGDQPGDVAVSKSTPTQKDVQKQ